jgi:hypothetical protein
MSLVRNLADLAARIAMELKTKVTPAHVGVAKAWVSFGQQGTAARVHASFNVAAVERQGVGRYRVVFATPFVNAGFLSFSLA